MPSCSLKNCGARKSKNQPELTLHRFPVNGELRQKWLQIIGAENINQSHKMWYLCSLHFDETSFNRTLDVTRLHDGAMPSLSLLACREHLKDKDVVEETAAKKPRTAFVNLEPKSIPDIEQNDHLVHEHEDHTYYKARSCQYGSLKTGEGDLQPGESYLDDPDPVSAERSASTSIKQTLLPSLSNRVKPKIITDYDQLDSLTISYEEELRHRQVREELISARSRLGLKKREQKLIYKEKLIDTNDQTTEIDGEFAMGQGIEGYDPETELDEESAMEEAPFSWQASDSVVPCDMEEDMCNDVELIVQNEQAGSLPPPPSCGLCQQPVTGSFRFSCVQCAALELCRLCEQRDAHPHHYVLRVPATRPESEVQSTLRALRRALLAQCPVSIGDLEADEFKQEVKEELESQPDMVAKDPLDPLEGATPIQDSNFVTNVGSYQTDEAELELSTENTGLEYSELRMMLVDDQYGDATAKRAKQISNDLLTTLSINNVDMSSNLFEIETSTFEADIDSSVKVIHSETSGTRRQLSFIREDVTATANGERLQNIQTLQNRSKDQPVLDPIAERLSGREARVRVRPLPAALVSAAVGRGAVVRVGPVGGRSTTKHSTTQGSATQHSTRQNSAKLQHSATQNSARQNSAVMQHLATQNTATQRSATQLSATQHSARQNSAIMQHLATQHSATQRSTTENSALQHSATQRSATENSAMQHSATQYCATKYTATQRSVTQHSATKYSAAQLPATQLSPT